MLQSGKLRLPQVRAKNSGRSFSEGGENFLFSCRHLRIWLNRDHIDNIMKANISELDRSPLPFLHLIQALKHLPRTGWLRTVENPESVASHSFRLAFLGLLAEVGPALLSALYSLICM